LYWLSACYDMLLDRAKDVPASDTPLPGSVLPWSGRSP
jgi:hypothetical protein